MDEGQTRVTLTPVEPRSGRVSAYTTVERGSGPRPGVLVPPFAWTNIEDTPAPAKTLRGSGSYVVYEGLEVGLELRLRYTTVIRYKEDDAAPEVLVESRVGVQKRLALEWMDRERIHVSRLTARWRTSFAHGLAFQGRVTRRARFRWARRASIKILRAEARAGYRAIRLFRRITSAAVQLPDRLYSRWLRVQGHLHDRLGRQSLWQGMRDPKGLSTEQKGVVLFLSVALLAALIFTLNNVFSVLLPGFATGYRAVLGTFAMGAATAVALPFPPSELLVISPYLAAGAAVALLTIVSSKVAGAWLVYFIGDALNEVIKKETKGKPRLAALVAWMNRHAEKQGGYVLGAFMTIPFLPDTLALYVFAISGIPFRHYILAVFIGSLVRYGAVVGLLMFYGEAHIRELFG